MKLGIIIGHSPAKKGAKLYTGECEFDYNLKLTNELMYMITKELHHEPLFFWRDDFLKYPGNLQSMAYRIAAWGADFCIELHVNAATVEATGSEAIVLKGRNRPVSFAKRWQDLLFVNHGIRKRSIKVADHGKKIRGYHNLMILNRLGIDNVILEPCFGHYENREASFILRDPKGYAEIIKQAIIHEFGA